MLSSARLCWRSVAFCFVALLFCLLFGAPVLAQDTEPPQVQTTFPVTDAVNVSASAAPIFTDTIGPAYAPIVSVDFTEAISETTVTTATFTLVDVAGAWVTSTVRLEGSQIVLTPRVALVSGRYTATVTTGVMDLAGNPLAENHVWGFSVVVTGFQQIYLPLVKNESFTCAMIVDIPKQECQALRSLYDAHTTVNPLILAETGPLSDWFRSSSACRWPGVRCVSDAIDTLRLEGRELTSLPPELGNLSNLRELDLTENNLTSLPVELGNLHALTTLYLGDNDLSTLPPTFNNLSALSRLRLGDNNLTEFPATVLEMSTLEVLDLSGNQLPDLPVELGNLTALEDLYIGGNRLTALPEELGDLSNLRWFSASGNQLTTLPDTIGNLTNLSGLFFDNNQLTTLPATIGNISGQLNFLSLSGNLLTSLPDTFGNLATVTELYLDNNQLAALPSTFGNLANLRALDLNKNQLTSLPSGIGNLTHLGMLRLGNNQLTSLPPEFGNLSQVYWLELHNNPLSGEMPESFTGLSMLSSPVSRFTFYGTGWCVPASGPVADWYSLISTFGTTVGTGLICGQPPGGISGTVTLSDTTPLSGIQVKVHIVGGSNPDNWPLIAQTLTGETGTYQVDGLGQRLAYRVQFVDPGEQYTSQWFGGVTDPWQSTNVFVTLGEVRTGVDAVMQLAP